MSDNEKDKDKDLPRFTGMHQSMHLNISHDRRRGSKPVPCPKCNFVNDANTVHCKKCGSKIL